MSYGNLKWLIRWVLLFPVLCATLTACSLIPRQTASPKPQILQPAKPASDVTTTQFESFQRKVFFDSNFKILAPVFDTEIVGITMPETLIQGVESSTEPDLDQLISENTQEQLLHCKRVDRRLRSVSFRTCLLKPHEDSNFLSAGGAAIYAVNYPASEKDKPLGKVLVLGGVHGDELTSVSTVYLWMKTLYEFHSGLFDWRVVPIVNPDGFFQDEPQRTNANGVDLNRNLPTYQWRQLAGRYWEKYASGTKRKFPGFNPASEPETQWLVNEINAYQPDVIVTVHAPYNLVDYDAADRANAPRRLGILKGKSLGTFPGSLGRYAGEERNIPVITLELPHSTRMPSRESVDGIWLDLVAWLRQNINTSNIAGRSFVHCNKKLNATGCI